MLEHPQSVYMLLSKYDATLNDVKEILNTLGENTDIHLDTILKKDIFDVISAVFYNDGLAIDYNKIIETNKQEARKWVRLPNYFNSNKEAKKIFLKNRKLFYFLLSDARYIYVKKHKLYHIDDINNIIRELSIEL